MSQYKALTDITNINQVISKDHGLMIQKGDIIDETKENKERLERLVKINSAEQYEEKAAENDGEPDQDPENTQDPDPENDGEPDHDPEQPDPENNQEPENEGEPQAPADENQDPENDKDGLPEDLDELKKIADDFGINYAANIGAETLKKRINDHVNQ